MKLPPLSLYIHIPWCIRKCPYCDFNSHTLRDSIPEQNYIQQLLLDFSQDCHWIQGRTLQSIFIGGGTPSLLSGEAYQNLFHGLQQQIEFAKDIEITLEANPGTVEQARFSDYFRVGINRISIGCQSFDDEKLKSLGRIHGASDALKAVTVAKNAGFTRINCDVMFGLPDQSIKQAMHDLQTAMDLQLEHISWYQLTMEPNTYFYQHPPKRADDDTLWEMQTQGQSLLSQNGYHQYEISAYTQNQPCKHNLNYWLFGDYLAIGAGAHGKVTLHDSQEILRFSKYKHPKRYLDIEHHFIETQEVIAKAQLGFEFMLNALRLNQAIDLALFSERTGQDQTVILKTLTQAKEQGLINIQNNQIHKTDLGMRFTNDLMAMFL